MAKGIDQLKSVWLNNTRGKGERWKSRFASEEARQDWANKLGDKFGIDASTIMSSGMGKNFQKAQSDKNAADFNDMITESAADRWARNLRRALTQP